MEFPHLNDTKFPNLNTVDVYAYKNVFDYTRWVPNTKIYLTNVRWNGDYQDVVKFKDDAARDDWFDKKVEESDCAATITSNTVIINGTVKVPMPYDVASQFNYLVVDVPVMTSDDKMIDYETAEGYSRWHFFITDFAYGSPSATTLTLTLDFWTQYINSVGISYMFLERGHAPVAETDTETYLANPIDNTKYLLAPDVNYGSTTVSRGGKFVPFGNGEKYVVFGSVCPPSDLGSMGTVAESASEYSWSEPVFVNGTNQPDDTGRWNQEHDVSGYNWGNGKSYANTKTPARNSLTEIGRGMNNVNMYAVPESEADSFVNDCATKKPMFLNTIKVCFIAAREMLNGFTAIEFNGHTIYSVWGTENAYEISKVKLTKDMFGIPDAYSKFAKLYTSPYSELEITDNNGKSVTVKVEETGEMTAYGFTATSYPYLNIRTFLTGIGGVGSERYKWVNMLGETTEEMPNSDWYRFCFDSKIPTWELYMDGETAWELNNYNRTFGFGRESAIRNYTSSAEAVDNARENAYDLADKNKQNAYNSADTAKRNAYNTATAAKNNAYNSAQNMSNNHSNSRACASQITANNNACSTANLAATQTNVSQQTKVDYERSKNNNTNANTLSLITTAEENQRTNTIAQNETTAAYAEGISSMVGGALKAGTSGDIGGGLSALATGVGSMVAANTIMNTAQATINCNNALQEANAAYNFNCTADNNQYNITSNGYTFQQNNTVLGNNVNNATSNTNAANTCDENNTDNTVSTMRTNADNSYNAATTNADNSYSTATTNADNDRNTARNNAHYTAWQGLDAAQRVLRNAQDSAKALTSDAYNYAPVTLCAGGSHSDYAPDFYKTRGIQIKVRTQSEGAISQTASEFARYGYKLNQIYNPESLTLMKHFTYWKTRECWVYDKCETNDTAQTAIGLIFKNGVTVWSDPDEIGKVNPYDN